MYKKFLIGLGVAIALVFSFNICFATNTDGKGLQDAANGVRNVVGNAENTVEGAAKNISGKSKEATGSMEGGMNNATNNMVDGANGRGTTNTNGTNQDGRNNGQISTTNTNNPYVATRTATGDATFMGMNATAWTWLIIGIAAIAIVALVWYYSTQLTNKNNHDHLD